MHYLGRNSCFSCDLAILARHSPCSGSTHPIKHTQQNIAAAGSQEGRAVFRWNFFRCVPRKFDARTYFMICVCQQRKYLLESISDSP